MNTIQTVLKYFWENNCMPIVKEKYPILEFTRDKDAIYVNGTRILVPAEYDRFKAGILKKDIKLDLSCPR